MPLLNSKDQELAKQEFVRDRDNLTNIYVTQVTSVQDGLRGISDKQFTDFFVYPFCDPDLFLHTQL